MDKEIRKHCEAIERCNQRGGRMLSVVDLLEAETLTVELAAYALAAIRNGASFLVGAVPGGAGKTTVMGALLNFVPRDVELVAADSMASIRGASSDRKCYICHEIGSGPYYAYLWGEPLRAYFELPNAGHMLATNLHADTYSQAHHQICRQNGVAEESLRQLQVMFFMRVARKQLGMHRWISEVWESDGHKTHKQIFGQNMDHALVETTDIISASQLKKARRDIEQLAGSRVRQIEQVRAAVLEMSE
jgi:hypothetical protein